MYGCTPKLAYHVTVEFSGKIPTEFPDLLKSENFVENFERNESPDYIN